MRVCVRVSIACVRDVINIKSQRAHCCCVMCSPAASEGSYDLLACECIIFSVGRSSDCRQATRASLWVPIAQSLSCEICYRARNHEASSRSCVLCCCGWKVALHSASGLPNMQIEMFMKEKKTDFYSKWVLPTETNVSTFFYSIECQQILLKHFQTRPLREKNYNLNIENCTKK